MAIFERCNGKKEKKTPKTPTVGAPEKIIIIGPTQAFSRGFWGQNREGPKQAMLGYQKNVLFSALSQFLRGGNVPKEICAQIFLGGITLRGSPKFICVSDLSPQLSSIFGTDGLT